MLIAAGFVASKSEARRAIEQKGVKVDGVVVEKVEAMVTLSVDGVVVQKGKRNFVRVKQK